MRTWLINSGSFNNIFGKPYFLRNAQYLLALRDSKRKHHNYGVPLVNLFIMSTTHFIYVGCEHACLMCEDECLPCKHTCLICQHTCLTCQPACLWCELTFVICQLLYLARKPAYLRCAHASVPCFFSPCSSLITETFMGVYYHPRRTTSHDLSPQLGLIRQITLKYEKN